MCSKYPWCQNTIWLYSSIPPSSPFLSLLSRNPQKSSMTGVPFLSLEGALELNPEADPLQNEALVHMWMEVKIKPLLKSITKHFLSCLSTKNFSCSSYQMMYVWVSEHLTVSRAFLTLSNLSLLTGWGSSVNIFLRWIRSDRSGSIHSSCTPSYLDPT